MKYFNLFPKNEKNARILKNLTYTFSIKGFSLLLNLLILPAYIRFFDDRLVLGFWFTAISVLSWMLQFDFGIGNGLRNHLVESLAENNFVQVKKYISSAYGIFGIVIVTIYLIGAIVFQFIDWNAFFNVSEDLIPKTTINLVVFLIFTSISLQLFLRTINSIAYAMQKPFLPSLLALITTAMQYFYVITADSDTLENNLVSLSVVNIISVNLPLIAVTFIFFYKYLRKSIPDYKSISKHYGMKILKLGGVFFWLQIMFMFINNVNYFLISYLEGPGNVVEFQIYNQISGTFGALIHLGITPVWSEVTEAFKLNNYTWIGKLYKKLKFIGIIALMIQLLAIPFYQILINYWLKDNTIKVNLLYALTFSISGSIFIWNNIIVSIVNGLSKLKIQLVFYTLGGLLNAPIAILIYKFTGSWISVIFANIICLLPFCIIQTVWLNNFIDQKLKPEQTKI